MTDIRKPAERAARSEQLPLAFSHAAARGRDDLVVSDRMASALALIDAWPRWPSPVVALVGPSGSGKSHLAAIWREHAGAEEIRPDKAGREAAMQAATHTPVVFEDADRTDFDEDALFHVINNVRQHGQGLLITSRSFPLSWATTLPDLKSRLKAATVVEIGAPDEALLAQLIVKLFADRQLYIDDKIVEYIVTRMERSFEAAIAIVERLDRLALSRRTKIGRALAAEVLDEMDVAARETLSQ